MPLPTKLVQVRPSGLSVEQLAERLRRHDPPVMGMLTDGWFTLDLRTVREEEMREIVTAIRTVTHE